MSAAIEVDDLRTYFHTEEGVVRAVNGISFQIPVGHALGIVGESGSGKSCNVALDHAAVDRVGTYRIGPDLSVGQRLGEAPRAADAL